ncbi:hypothetical protein EJ04DRAFT_567741 [Polyplosphaeria fusca]|uniref:Uncharacterized protein n=1 Tax=Polyplosphaeria fusca TaxID=682080 RepID=A0A9P4QT27_9PLEO|nr:hypothetical protein EJ04DRAFT_567741 [Polyplosphaeria fusca]
MPKRKKHKMEAPLKPAKSSAFRLFDLPLEIRDMVYDQFWRDHSEGWLLVLVGQHTFAVELEPNAASSGNTNIVQPYWKLPRSILANKQFLQEIIGKLQAKSVWTQHYCQCRQISCNTSYCSKPQNRQNLLTRTLTPYSGRHLHLGPIYMTFHQELLSNGKDVALKLIPDVYERQWFTRLAYSINLRGPAAHRIHHLNFSLNINDDEILKQNLDYHHVDLGMLQRFSIFDVLKSIEVSLCWSTLDSIVPYTRLQDHHSRSAAGLERFAESVMGRGEATLSEPTLQLKARLDPLFTWKTIWKFTKAQARSRD